MSTKLNSKLLDVVRFPDREVESHTGVHTGTIVELLKSTPKTALIEIADDDGVLTDLVISQLQDLETTSRVPDVKRQADPSAQDLFEEGLLLLNNGLVTKAKAAFREAFRLDPQYAGTLNNLARDAMAERGAFDAALFLFQMILELQPNYRLALENLASTHLNRGVAFAHQDAIENAIGEFNTAILLRPSDDILHLSRMNLVAAYTALGIQQAINTRYREAVPLFSLALQIEPGNETARKNLALAIVSATASEREHEELPGEEEFRGFALMGLTLSEFLNAYGATLSGLGQVSKAQKAIRRAVEADPTNALARSNLEILESREVSPQLSLGIIRMETEAAPMTTWN